MKKMDQSNEIASRKAISEILKDLIKNKRPKIIRNEGTRKLL